MLMTSLVLILPAFSGYDFIIDWFYEFCLMLIFASGYYFVVVNMRSKALKSLLSFLLSLFILLSLVFVAFTNGFFGGERIHNTWRSEGYKIEEVESYGFSGRSVYYYRLVDSPFFGLFNKTVDSKNVELFNVENNFINDFESEGVTFNNDSKTIILHSDNN